jgi:hypothetical protein
MDRKELSELATDMELIFDGASTPRCQGCAGSLNPLWPSLKFHKVGTVLCDKCSSTGGVVITDCWFA